MGFVRIEDRMSEGRKFDGIPSAAGWLHVCAMLYASRALTDGFVPAGRVHKLTNDRPEVVNRAVRWLTTARANSEHPLWHEVAGGYQIHDYADAEYGNPTRAGAQAARERAARAGEASADVRRQRYGTAQPSSRFRTTPEQPVPTAPEQPVRGPLEQPVRGPLEQPVRDVLEHLPNSVPPRTTPTRTTEPDGSSVEGFSPKARQEKAPARRAAEVLTNQADEDPDVAAYAERFMHHAARAPSADDLTFFRRVPYECDRLSRDVVLAAIDDVAEKHLGRGKPMPRATYLAGKLADLQAQASDAGVTSRTRSPNGRMAHVSAPPPGDSDDD